MAEINPTPSFIDKRLSITRETELLQSFVGVSKTSPDDDETKEDAETVQVPPEDTVNSTTDDTKPTTKSKSKTTKTKNTNKQQGNQKDAKKKIKRKKRKLYNVLKNCIVTRIVQQQLIWVRGI